MSRSTALPQCSQYQACGVIEYQLAVEESEEPAAAPPEDIVAVDDEGSGEGSGEVEQILTEAATRAALAYDEAIEGDMFPADPLKNASVASQTEHPLCDCPADACPLANATADGYSIRLDAYLELRLCRPVVQMFPRRCRGARGVVRVMGEAHADLLPTTSTGQIDSRLSVLESYNETLLFCHCPNELYRRTGVELWRRGLLQALKFGCA